MDIQRLHENNEFYVFPPGFLLCQTNSFYAARQFLQNYFIITAEIAELRHFRFSMVEQLQQRLARIKSKPCLFTWAGSFFSFKLQPTYMKQIIITLLIHNIPHWYWRNTLSCNVCHKLDIYKLVKRLASFICQCFQ